MRKSFFPRLVAIAICATAVSVAQASFTVGTFADPAANSSQNFFKFTRFSATDVLLEGAWLTDGLHLLTPGISAPDQFNARFEIRDSSDNFGLSATDTGGGAAMTEPGYVRFFDAANTTLLRIDFDEAMITSTGFGAGFGLGTNAVMTGSIVEPGWEDEHFGFAFTNFNIVNSNTISMSASFTSSAVPEPATLAVLGLGAAALLRRRRKS